jgi:AcrR family transcriptional regulator
MNLGYNIMNKFIKNKKKRKNMPKIIENARGMLLDEAKRQIEADGYESVTIRSIAKGCGLGLGTFYNYFKSKDMLIATFLLEDWKNRMARITEYSKTESNPLSVVKSIHKELGEFMESNKGIFVSPEAIRSFNNSVSGYHNVLRSQIAEPILISCTAGGYDNSKFLSQFVAESILTWTVAKKSFEELEPIFIKLFKK